MEIRILTQKDIEEVKKLWIYCFESHEPFYSWYFQEYYSSENTLAIFKEDRMLSCLQLIPYDIYLRGQVLPTSYVVGVATFPNARNEKSAGRLLEASIKEMKNRGQSISLLMPFNAGFYYPYQWQFCYHHYKYNIPLDDLKPISSAYGDFEQIKGLEKVEEMDIIYKDFVKGKHGYVVRDNRKWQLMMEEHEGEKGFGYLLKAAGLPRGYILYYLKDDKFTIREMAYTGWDAQRSLFNFIYNHRSQVKDLEWHAPLDDTAFFFLNDAKEGISLYPFLMARIINVEKLLTEVCYPASILGETCLSVKDEIAPWNNQTFHIAVKNGKGQIAAVNKPPIISMDIGALTQLVFGRLSAGELLGQGKIVGTVSDIELLDKLFPKCNNYINEYY
ncbi:MAG: GNAT family N-acetyltransferase [Bacillota bacterium]